MVYLSLAQVLALHKLSLQRFGGVEGIRDKALFESAVMRPMQSVMGQDAYPDVFSKTAALLESLVLNHPFLDGNKRTAFIASIVMLEVNGWKFCAEEMDAADFVLAVAAGKIKGVEKIAAWLKSNTKSK